jgi:hypothetical protein
MAGLVAFLAIVLFLTLTPRWSAGDSAGLIENASADFVRNVLLLVPLGVALAMIGLPMRHAFLAGLGLATSIEFIQGFVPGRFSDLTDVATNALGATAGAWLWHHRQGVERPPRWVTAAAVAAVLSAPILVSVLLRPSLPSDRVWRGDWTPDQWTRYKGRVRVATVGGHPLMPSRAIEASSFIPPLVSTVDIGLTVAAGPAPRQRVVIVRIYDDASRELMDVSIEGTDILFRIRARAMALRFQQPAMRWRDAFAAVRQADTVLMVIRRDGAETCLTVNARQQCLTQRLRDGWMILAPEKSIPATRTAAVGWVFLAALVFPVGLLTSGIRGGAVAAGLLAIGMLSLPPLVNLGPPTPADWLAMAGGGATGAVFRRALALTYPARVQPSN